MSVEAGSSYRDFFTEVQRRSDGERLSAGQVRRIAQRFGQKVLGSGRESVVVPYLSSENLVFAFDYGGNGILTVAAAREYFHIHRILSTLWPHNFPRVVRVFGQPENNEIETVTGSVRKWIYRTRARPQYPFSDALEAINWLGLPIYIEEHSGNIVRGHDGGEYFLDRAELFEDSEWPITGIIAYMKSRLDQEEGYSSDDIVLVRASLAYLMGDEAVAGRPVGERSVE